MSQVNQPAPRPSSTEPSASSRAPTAHTRAAPPAQAHSAFNAALQRAQDYDDPNAEQQRRPSSTQPGASTRPRRNDEADAEHGDALGQLGPLNPFAALGGQQPAGAIAHAEALPGAMPQQLPMPGGQTGLSAQSQAGQSIAGARQFNLQLPTDAAAALSLRLTQAGANHWQLRLSADTATRQQLAPHVERLRDRLRDRQGQHSADFDFDDDGAA